MQYLFKICLNLAEWIEDQRGSWRARRQEKKSILTFLSQGALGGMIGYFLLIVWLTFPLVGCGVFCHIGLPVILTFGAIWGALVGFFIWLPGALLQRRIGFAGRAVIANGATSLLFASLFYFWANQPDYETLFIGYFCIVNLPIVLLTGAAIRPGRALVFGAGGRFRRRRYRNWLATPSGFLLRATSIFGMFEALLALVVWVGERMSPPSDGSGVDGLATIVLANTYFVASTYFSFQTPRKSWLPPIALALNLPAVLLTVSAIQLGSVASDFLAYSYVGFICLWTFYTVGCLRAPEAAARAARFVNGIYTLKGVATRESKVATVNYCGLG